MTTKVRVFTEKNTTDQDNTITIRFISQSATSTRNSYWKIYWGIEPLPEGAEPIGVVYHESGDGALIRLDNGTFVQGNKGVISSLPQHEINTAIKMAGAASILGSIKSEKKSRTSANNGKKGGRPIKSH